MDTLAETPSSIATRQVEEMVAAWRRGERTPAEVFLEGHPDLGDEASIRLIFEEYCLREEAGLDIDPADFARRFPRLWPELEILLDCHRLMEPGAVPAVLPDAGENLAEFRLLAELGRGVLGKVFLASEFALADRPVVIKVTPIGRGEHLSLARLQHMSIVPLYSAQVLPDRNLQVLCMPFLGGATLAQVLGLLKDLDPSRRTGAQIVEAMDRVQAGLPVTLPPARGPFRSYIGRSPYVEAICFLGTCIADGLQYAHDRNFVHMDIKPSNVLLAGDGQPMLLDFHLAREPLAEGDPPPAHLGGTPGYLPPEQAEAMRSVTEGRPILTPLDGRADLYSLGLLLREALGGPCLDDPRPLHRINPRVPVGLSDIVAKCLRPGPADRYPDAASLAADLRRHQDGLPLRGVPNRSLTERWGNWRRRRPHALTRGLILVVSALVAIAASALLWAAYLQRVHEIEAALAGGRASLGRRQYPEANKALRRGLALAEQIPGVGRQRRELVEGIARARKEARADDLHRLAELVRFRYGLDPPPPEEAQRLIGLGRALWEDRGLLLAPIAGRTEPEGDAVIRTDLLDLALAWAALRARSAPAEGARTEALRVLDQAEAALGPAAAIGRDRRVHAGLTGPDAPIEVDPGSAWGHFELGKSYLRTGETARAAEEFRLGLGLRPQDFWLNFYQGACAYRLGRFDEAANAFRVCIALSPDSAECSFNRALAAGALGRDEAAIDDYSRALRQDPSLTAAAINRGMLRYKQGRHADASTDLRRALATAFYRSERGLIHYDLALVDLARGDRPAALSDLERAERCGHEAARTLLDRLRR